MSAKSQAAFLDFATLGANVDTSKLDALVDVRYHDFSDASEVAARLVDCEIAIVNKSTVGADAIRAAKRLRLIALTGTGSDNVDVAAAEQCAVAVANTRGYGTSSVAQHVFALILELTRRIGGYAALVRRGAWQESRMSALLDFPIRELDGLTLGIVGSGTLGQAVARLGGCFGMRVVFAARLGTARAEVPAGRVHFDDVLERADVLTLHCPLTPATRNMIGAPQLQRMKRDALLINTARGGLVDGEALAAALRAGVIGGAGIDVLPAEPPRAGHPLLEPGIPNLVVTPHVAWGAREARQRALDQVTENIAEFLRGGSLRRIA
jgi:glycerate dehydrogenase